MTRTAKLIKRAKAAPGNDPASGMSFLLVVGAGDKADIRFEGDKQFLDIALEAIEGLVDDIVAADKE